MHHLVLTLSAQHMFLIYEQNFLRLRVTSSVNLWRERVLGLEQDVAYLQNQFNHERI